MYVPFSVDTIAEIASHPNPVTTFGTNFRDIIEESSDPTISQMSSKYVEHFDTKTALQNLSLGTHILFESQTNSRYNIRKLFTNE